ncbi:phage tail tape measure protein, TP901 family, core region [Bradyrhizobium yuanmingense]|uniref:Phage tail tape measure protein, TP901 family, core region n=1 Tax=Bradyrhizobium yuanmingense TaxID=108015 RepID=A0A1C3VRY4_9BRAD|nr:phage tail tape measure protein [Bradyrhizobium yuanmingense]TWI28867.1 TP901 family phage tail tape measure protein [Bradyrhizobium yuanmingense]SCB30377.1 phage tail tape measure protein, TP901 family, core region [Bradyrhizobium yuanmingense]
MSENLNVRAILTATNEMSPVLKSVLADLRKFEVAAKRISSAFTGVGDAGFKSMAGFDRTIRAASAQMKGMENLSRSVARTYAADWSRANTQRLNDARRTHAALERLEASYQRQLSRTAAAERRAGSGRSYGGSVGRLPAPNLRTIAAGAAITGAGVASALRKRMEVQAAEVRAQMFGDLDKGEIGKLRRDYADKAGIRYGIGSSKVIDTAVEGLKAGVAKQFAGEFADLALKAQAGLDVNPEAVGKLLGRLSTQMPWDTGRFSKILNAVAVANNATAADGNEIIEAMRRSLSALATTKMTPEQLAAIDATGISLGVQPHKMGTFVSFLSSQIAGADSARGQQASDLNSAANALGFGGRSGMAKTMRERPMEAIQQILDNLAKMPERLRTKVANQIGGREWMDELLTLVLGRDKLRDVVRDIESKPGFLDKTALQKIRSMQGRWATISAALGLVWEKVGAGLETWFDQISESVISLADSFNFDSIREHFAALVDGAREGFGLKDWGEVVKSMADNFDAGTVAKWREFGRGFAEGIREFANGLKTAFSGLGFLAGKNPADARAMGNLVAQLTGLTVALAALSPLISVLAAVTVGLTGLGNALAFIAGMPAAVALLSMFATRYQNYGVPDANIKRPGESTSDWRARQREHRKELYKKSSYEGPTDFSGRRRTSDLSDELNKFTGKVERAAFINSSLGGGLQYAALGGAGRGLGRSGGGLGSGLIGNVPDMLRSQPGSFFSADANLGSIIRRDKIPSFGGVGPGGIPSSLNRSAFERTFAGTPMARKYDQIIASARRAGVSPALLASVMAQETGRGQHMRGNNPGGLTGRNGLMQFGDLDSGIDRTALAVAKNFNAAGGDLAKMRDTYAPLGAKNDPKGLNASWLPGVQKFMGEMGGGSDSAGTGDALGWASKFKGMNEYTDTKMLAAALGGDVRGKSNAWCARFVNKALESAGGKGTGSAVANSFQRWGSAVDPSSVSRNDVLLQTGGKSYMQTGGHVGLATGETRMNNGRLQVKMLAGNDNDSVREHWIDADKNLMVRRGNSGVGVNVPQGITSQVPPASAIQNVPTRSSVTPGVGAGDIRSSGGPVAIHINGNSHDPEALATLVQRRIDEQMNWRTHDTASEYT